MTSIYTYLFCIQEALHLLQYNFTDPEPLLSSLRLLPFTGRKGENII